jgi:drug/metabolite transporter (DMT)-like permease
VFIPAYLCLPVIHSPLSPAPRLSSRRYRLIGILLALVAIIAFSLLGGVLLGESMSPVQLAGAALVIVGVLLATVGGRAAKTA